MGHPLLYKFEPGQELTYKHASYMSLTQPDQERLFGHVTYVRTQRLVGKVGNDFEIEFTQKLVDKAGILCEQIPQELQHEETGRLVMGARGNLVSDSSMKVPSFPEGEVEEGDSWTVDEQGLAIVFALEHFEERDGEVIAQLASTTENTSQDGGEEVHMEVGSRLLFSITRGCALESKSLITQTWTSGRVIETVVETELL